MSGSQRSIAEGGKRNEAPSFTPSQYLVRSLLGNALVKGLVAHHDRGSAATGEALDKLDRELPVLRRLRPVRLRVEAELLAQVIMQ